MAEVAPKLPQGDNDNGDAKDVEGIGGQRLKAFIERLERMEEEKAAVMDDIKEIYAEAKAVGFEPKIIRKVLKIKNMDQSKRQEEESLLDIYMLALGMK